MRTFFILKGNCHSRPELRNSYKEALEKLNLSILVGDCATDNLLYIQMLYVAVKRILSRELKGFIQLFMTVHSSSCTFPLTTGSYQVAWLEIDKCFNLFSKEEEKQLFLLFIYFAGHSMRHVGMQLFHKYDLIHLFHLDPTNLYKCFGKSGVYSYDVKHCFVNVIWRFIRWIFSWKQ